MKRPGALAIVLHTHMPYVEGFGTWPFGEEWLWEAIATSYLPLLEVLGRAPVTLSLTLVLSNNALALPVQDAIVAHRGGFGGWQRGFWLPECAYAPWLVDTLEGAGVRHTCVELTERFGLGHPAHLTPVATEAGPVLWPI